MDTGDLIIEAVRKHWKLYGSSPPLRWLADEVDRAHSVVSYWIDKLDEEGRLRKVKSGTGVSKILLPGEEHGQGETHSPARVC